MSSVFKTKFTPEAIQELQEAINYYNSQKAGLGKKFYLDIKNQINLICSNPFLKSIRYDDVRFALADKFPYAIHYTIVKEKNIIIIHAVFSNHQDPDNWK